MKAWLTRVQQATYNTSFMYNVRMIIAFTATAFVPYLLGQQLATIPLTLGVVAAALSDIDDRFSVRIMNLVYTYIGFFITAASIQFLFPYPVLFAIGLIISCIGWILLGSAGVMPLFHMAVWLFQFTQCWEYTCLITGIASLCSWSQAQSGME